MCDVDKYFIAVVFIKRGLNDTPVPWQYGMQVKLQRLGREWKGKLPFNIYAPKLIFTTTELLVDHGNGHWKSMCWLNLNTKPNQRRGDEYMIQVEIIGGELLYYKGASNKMITKLDFFDVHRPKSIMRYLFENGDEMGLEVDKEFCQNFLKAYDIAQKNGTKVEDEMEKIDNLNLGKSVSVSSSSVDDHDQNVNIKMNKSKNKSSDAKTPPRKCSKQEI